MEKNVTHRTTQAFMMPTDATLALLQAKTEMRKNNVYVPRNVENLQRKKQKMASSRRTIGLVVKSNVAK